MDASEFLRLRREGAIRGHDSARAIVDPFRGDNLLNPVVADAHVVTKLCLDDFLRIVTHNDKVASLVARPTRELCGVSVTLVEPLYQCFETGTVEFIEAAPSAVVQRLQCEVTFTFVDETAEYAVQIFFVEGKAMLLKVVEKIPKMLARKGILLILERRVFCLCSSELIQEVIQRRAIVFRDRPILLKPFAVLISAPEDRPDKNQNDKNDEPSDSLIEQEAVCKIETEGGNESETTTPRSSSSRSESSPTLLR